MAARIRYGYVCGCPRCLALAKDGFRYASDSVRAILQSEYPTIYAALREETR